MDTPMFRTRYPVRPNHVAYVLWQNLWTLPSEFHIFTLKFHFCEKATFCTLFLYVCRVVQKVSHY